jgi:hypothetical protein
VAAGVNKGVVSSLKTGVDGEGRDSLTAKAKVPLFLLRRGQPEDLITSWG